METSGERLSSVALLLIQRAACLFADHVRGAADTDVADVDGGQGGEAVVSMQQRQLVCAGTRS
jgi:hypothetical protein